jgi:hypothetical protein
MGKSLDKLGIAGMLGVLIFGTFWIVAPIAVVLGALHFIIKFW